MRIDKVEVWVDGQGYGRRSVTNVTVDNSAAGAGVLAVWIDMRMSRHNEDIAIAAPEDFVKMADLPPAPAAPATIPEPGK